MQTMVPLYGFGGGGGTGAALAVTAPAGCTVTVSKDGKTKTKVAGTDGVAVFKWLASGEWTISITDGEQTAQKTVTITADYSTAITFFAATIHITYPAGSTCTATDGVTTLTAPNTSGTWACVVPNAGTWTVSLDSGFYEKVTITGSGEEHTLDKWHLYNRGEDRTSITGGWVATVYCSLTMGTEYIESRSTMGGSHGFYFTNSKIDITGFKSISFLYSNDTSNPQNKFMITKDQDNDDMVATVSAVYSGGISTIQTISANISSISGAYYIGYMNYGIGRLHSIELIA